MSPGEVIESVNEEPSGALDIETRALETPEQLLGKFLTNAQGQELAKHQYQEKQPSQTGQFLMSKKTNGLIVVILLKSN